MKNIFFLNKFYTPKIINVIYWLSAVLYMLVGLFLVIDGYDAEERLQGLFLFVFGPVLARVMAELTVVPFRIYDKVCKIADKMAADEEKHNAEKTQQETSKDITE